MTSGEPAHRAHTLMAGSSGSHHLLASRVWVGVQVLMSARLMAFKQASGGSTCFAQTAGPGLAVSCYMDEHNLFAPCSLPDNRATTLPPGLLNQLPHTRITCRS